MPTRTIKFCGLTSVSDAEAAISAGATHLGLILAPRSPRVITVEAAHTLSQAIHQLNQTYRPDFPAQRVGVFMDEPLDQLLAKAEAIGFDMVQLHGQETVTYCQSVLQRWPVIKAFTVVDPIDLLTQIAPYQAAMSVALLDMPKPGSEDVLDWHRQLAQSSIDLPNWWLAGKLTPDNVAQVVAFYGNRAMPAGLDVASGIEQKPGVKDPHKMDAFVRQAQNPIF